MKENQVSVLYFILVVFHQVIGLSLVNLLMVIICGKRYLLFLLEMS